jgi:hypothetical protein
MKMKRLTPVLLVDAIEPALAQSPQRGTFLFIEVDDLDTVAKQLTDVTPVIPRRKTFYGSDELGVREPCGNVVTFAQFAKQP